MRYRLRTLAVATAIVPPLLALAWLHGTPILIVLILFLCYIVAFATFMAIAFMVVVALEVVLELAERLVSRK